MAIETPRAALELDKIEPRNTLRKLLIMFSPSDKSFAPPAPRMLRHQEMLVNTKIMIIFYHIGTHASLFGVANALVLLFLPVRQSTVITVPLML
jgi:hypothetical protein